ncbi:MAG: class I SAM-dependent methyltransferase [Leptolyngbyaceae bacterium]|nr:class I SAM-dependent methyltransferase [Leptolyngbyaceae bacterium]
MSNLRDIHSRTIKTYELHARNWDEQRAKVLFEKDWLDRFIAYLPAGGAVLDIGCGAGIPISQYLLSKGFKLTGVDASATMIGLSRSRFPEGKWIVMDMRSLSLPQKFDGIIGWDSFFHLDMDEQRVTLSSFCRYLNVGGTLLLTIGDKAGEVLGMVDGQQVYHSSLDPMEYKEMLIFAGFLEVTTVLGDKNCGGHSILMASGFRG